MPKLEHMSLSGAATVRTVNPLLTEHPSSINMVLDILFERGYTAVLDIQVTSVPRSVCRDTGSVALSSSKVWVLQVTWPKPALRPETSRH